jgi:hypothetical protein
MSPTQGMLDSNLSLSRFQVLWETYRRLTTLKMKFVAIFTKNFKSERSGRKKRVERLQEFR